MVKRHVQVDLNMALLRSFYHLGWQVPMVVKESLLIEVSE